MIFKVNKVNNLISFKVVKGQVLQKEDKVVIQKFSIHTKITCNFKVRKEGKIEILKVGIKSTWTFFRKSKDKSSKKRGHICDPAS